MPEAESAVVGNADGVQGSLRKQLITCAVLCAVAVVVIVSFHRKPYGPALLSGLPLLYQMLLGLALGAIYWVVAGLGQRLITSRTGAQSIAESYRRLDLSGLNPVWIALAAGFGEELLFRGALQPLLGIWITSVLFVLVHIRAYRLNKLDKRVFIQSVSIFGISLVFGSLAIYSGLITAMMVHASMDVVGLYAVRRMSHVMTTATAH